MCTWICHPRLTFSSRGCSGHPNFELVRADVVEPFMVEVDQVSINEFLVDIRRLC